MSGLTTTDKTPIEVKDKAIKINAKDKSKDTVTGLVQQSFRGGYESPIVATVTQAYVQGVEVGIKEGIADLLQGIDLGSAIPQGFLNEALATLPTSTADCDWWLS